MAYGMSFEDVRRINIPESTVTPWGSTTVCTQAPQYCLTRVELKQGRAQPLHFYPGGERTVFLEAGDVLVRRLDRNGGCRVARLPPGSVLTLAEFEVHGFCALTNAELYLFGPADKRETEVWTETQENAARAAAALNPPSLQEVGRPTTHRLAKYWGEIETILNGEVAGKRIFIKQGGQSSLEFHVHKYETYWIRSGLLKVGLRVGRANNHSILVRPGESYDIRPGMMHMRMAIEDTIIIEVSTRDSDADSHLVEDGQTYRHIDSFPDRQER